MKKIVKIISAIAMAFILCVPLALVGCAKHYTITISIVSGSGYVRKIGTTQNLDRVNDVEEGKSFEYGVIPQTHYEIDYVKQNGETIYNVELGANNKYTPNKSNGAIYFPIVDVDKEYSILVAFRPVTYYIEYYFTNDGGDYEQFVYGGDVYRTEGNCATKLGIEEFASLNLKRFDGTQYVALGFTKDSVLTRNWTLYTEASEAELKAVLGLE